MARVSRLIDRHVRSAAARRFRGRFATFADAMAGVRPGLLAGYDNDAVSEVAYADMCRLELWDYPVLFWLDRLVGQASGLLDIGGHMGTKYRAFSPRLHLPAGFDWAVHDVPAIVRAGRARALREGLRGISFHDRLEQAPATGIVLASGLLQYLDEPFARLVDRLPERPRHVILNKVATREGPTVVTLEQFPGAEVPYIVRDHAGFTASLAAMGYAIRDSWTIAQLSHAHSAFGVSTSRGFYLERSD